MTIRRTAGTPFQSNARARFRTSEFRLSRASAILRAAHQCEWRNGFGKTLAELFDRIAAGLI